jgi:hypothetical protein
VADPSPYQLTWEGGTTVPVMLDAIREIDGEPMARCVYLVISAEEPTAGWNVAFAGTRIPVALIGLAAIVFQPDAQTARFDDVEAIDRLYASVESIPGLIVEIDDLWLPGGLFAGGERGWMFRVGFDLFSRGYAFGQNRLSAEELVVAAGTLRHTVTLSREETAAFTSWNARVIAEAREIYHRNEARALAWKA